MIDYLTYFIKLNTFIINSWFPIYITLSLAFHGAQTSRVSRLSWYKYGGKAHNIQIKTQHPGWVSVCVCGGCMCVEMALRFVVNLVRNESFRNPCASAAALRYFRYFALKHRPTTESTPATYSPFPSTYIHTHSQSRTHRVSSCVLLLNPAALSR